MSQESTRATTAPDQCQECLGKGVKPGIGHWYPCPSCSQPSPSTGGEPTIEIDGRTYTAYEIKGRIQELDYQAQIAWDASEALAAKVARGEPATDSTGRELREAARDFYNVTVADTAVRISSDIEEKRDIAAAAANRLRDALIATREPAPVARELDAEAGFRKWWMEPSAQTGVAPERFMDVSSARAAWFAAQATAESAPINVINNHKGDN